MSEIEIINSITFYGFAITLVVFAFLTLLSNKIMYSLIFAVIVFFASGAIFFALGADYNAIIQIMVYGVAVPILLLFSITFSAGDKEKIPNIVLSPRFLIGFVSAAVLFMILWYTVEFTMHINKLADMIFNRVLPVFNSVETFSAISKVLYCDYGIVFILLGFLILITVVGLTTFNIVKEKKHG